MSSSSILDILIDMPSFYGFDLRTGTLAIAVMGILHPFMYCCTCFIPMSYMLVTAWVLVAIYFVVSLLLFYGAYMGYPLLYFVWTWYALFFVILMLVLMVLMITAFHLQGKRYHVLAAILGLLWYMTTIYFILVVNTHRKQLMAAGGNFTTIFDPNITGSVLGNPVVGNIVQSVIPKPELSDVVAVLPNVLPNELPNVIPNELPKLLPRRRLVPVQTVKPKATSMSARQANKTTYPPIHQITIHRNVSRNISSTTPKTPKTIQNMTTTSTTTNNNISLTTAIPATPHEMKNDSWGANSKGPSDPLRTSMKIPETVTPPSPTHTALTYKHSQFCTHNHTHDDYTDDESKAENLPEVLSDGEPDLPI